MTTMAISASAATYLTSFTLNLVIMSLFILAIHKFSIKRLKATKIIITTIITSLIFCYMFEHFFVKNMEIKSLPFIIYYTFVFYSTIIFYSKDITFDLTAARDEMCSGAYGYFFLSPDEQAQDDQPYEM
jgi:hypothetical protein